MSWLAIVFIVVNMVGLFLAIMARGRAEALLSPEQKNQVASVLAMNRLFWVFMQLYALIAVALFVFVPGRLPAGLSQTAFVLVIAAFIWSQLRLVKRVRALGLPPRYVQVFAISRMAMYGGLLLVGVFLLSDMIRGLW